MSEQTMNEKTKHLGDAFSGVFIAQALLKDYANVVAKIENCTPEEVTERVKAEAKKLAKEFTAKSKELGVE